MTGALTKAMMDDLMRGEIERLKAAGEPTAGRLMICVTADHEGFEDDLFTDCGECGVRLRYRPYMPDDVKRICLGCATSFEVGRMD